MRLSELAGMTQLIEGNDSEQKKADQRYKSEVNQFRAALSANNRKLARELVDEFDWSTDAISDELNDWFEG